MCLSESEPQGSDAETTSTEWLNHCAVTWIIKNCAIYLFSGDVSLESEWFTSQTPTTSWQIRANVKEKSFSISLARAENDDGQETVMVNYKLSVNYEGTTSLLCQQYVSVKKGSVFSMFPDARNPDRPDLLNSQFIDLDCLEIIFEMFVMETDKENTISNDSSDWQDLSHDLLNLYESGDFCDIILQTKDGELMAHKAILARRSPYFAAIDKKIKVTALKRFHKKVIDKILRYMYSGSFELLPSDLPDIFEILDSVNTLKPSNLNQAFDPKEINICMEAETANFEFRWSIEYCEWKAHDDGKEIRHDFVTPKGTWTLLLQPKGEKPENIELTVSVSDLGEEISALVQAFTDVRKSHLNFDELGKKFFASRNVKSGDKFIFPNFVPKFNDKDFKQLNVVESDLNINLTVKCSMPQMSLKTNVTRKFSRCRGAVLPPEDFNRLSEDLLKLLHKGYYSDVELEIQDRRLKVHKAIIIARWPHLATLIGLKMEENSIFTMQYTYSKAMMEVLTYVYSGKINLDTKDIAEIGEICYLAHAYRFPKLRELCYASFKSVVTTSNVHLLLLWAQVAYVEQLEAFALTYIANNSEEIFCTPVWEDCREINPEITKKVESWVREGGLP